MLRPGRSGAGLRGSMSAMAVFVSHQHCARTSCKELRWLALAYHRQPSVIPLCGHFLTPNLFHIRHSGIPLGQLLRGEEVY